MCAKLVKFLFVLDVKQIYKCIQKIIQQKCGNIIMELFNDNLKILTDLVSYLALVHLTYVVYINDYRFDLAISLIVAVSIVNLVFKGEVHSLYANLILAVIVILTLYYSGETNFNKAFYFLAYLATSVLSYFISLQKRIRGEKLKESKERLELAVEGANLGVWDWDIKTGEVLYDDKWLKKWVIKKLILITIFHR